MAQTKSTRVKLERDFYLLLQGEAAAKEVDLDQHLAALVNIGWQTMNQTEPEQPATDEPDKHEFAIFRIDPIAPPIETRPRGRADAVLVLVNDGPCLAQFDDDGGVRLLRVGSDLIPAPAGWQDRIVEQLVTGSDVF